MMSRARRLVVAFAGLMLVAFVGLSARLVWLQVCCHDEALIAAQKQSIRSRALPARRGDVIDRYGRVLACSTESTRLAVLPRNLPRPGETPASLAGRVRKAALRLSPLVGMPAEELARRMRGERYAILGAPITDPAVIEALEQERRGLLWGVDFEHGWSRHYPFGPVAGNLVGYVGHVGDEPFPRGVAGLEQGLDEHLSGLDGVRRTAVDHRGTEVHLGGTSVAVPPTDGLDVCLTLDVRLQQVLEHELLVGMEEHHASRAMGVALDPRTGEVLALASVPGLDPGDTSQRTRENTVHAALQEVYPPGSTFKPLMMAAALELGLARVGEPPLDCRPSKGVFGGRTIHDSHPQEEPLDLEQILVHSSNIGMATLFTRHVPAETPKALELMAPVHTALMRLGLGRRVGLPIVGEVAGTVTRLPDWDRNYTLASVAFGQELAVSAMQMAAAASCLAEGLYRRPRLILGYIDPLDRTLPGPDEPPVPVFSPQNADLVRSWMVAAVEEGGCREIAELGVSVAGKTGTAQDGLELERETHSYVALVPAERPEITLVVALRDPQGARFSSQTAAPVAARILRRMLPYLGHPLEGIEE